MKWGADEVFLEAQREAGWEPPALRNKPVIGMYEYDVLTKYLTLRAMIRDGMSASRLSLLEIDLYRQYYPVSDVYYFIDLMLKIDKLVTDGINTGSKDRR
jgi:hypothetical protein